MTDKAQRVANYNKFIHYGAGLIAHSCGVSSARGLTRQHASGTKMVIKPLDKMYEHYNK